MKIIPVIGLAALVSTSACNITFHEPKVFSVNNSYGTLDDNTDYIKSIEIKYNGDDYTSLRISTTTTSRSGKKMPEFSSVKDLEIGKYPYSIKIIHLLPLQILDEHISPESIDGSVVDFIFESEGANSDIKLSSPLYIRMDRRTIERYRQEWQAWQEFNKPLPKRY